MHATHKIESNAIFLSLVVLDLLCVRVCVSYDLCLSSFKSLPKFHTLNTFDKYVNHFSEKTENENNFAVPFVCSVCDVLLLVRCLLYLLHSQSLHIHIHNIKATKKYFFLQFINRHYIYMLCVSFCINIQLIMNE